MWLALGALVVALGVDVGDTTFRGPHHPKDHKHYVPREGGPKITRDTSLLRDAKHIQEDLDNLVSNVRAEKLSAEEMEFHYFKLHDFDNNTKLDGLEILQAIRHSVEYDDFKSTKDKRADHHPDHHHHHDQQDMVKDFDFFINLIDKVLEEDDLDQDGFLSYTEYVIGRQRDSRGQ